MKNRKLSIWPGESFKKRSSTKTESLNQKPKSENFLWVFAENRNRKSKTETENLAFGLESPSKDARQFWRKL